MQVDTSGSGKRPDGDIPARARDLQVACDRTRVDARTVQFVDSNVADPAVGSGDVHHIRIEVDSRRRRGDEVGRRDIRGRAGGRDRAGSRVQGHGRRGREQCVRGDAVPEERDTSRRTYGTAHGHGAERIRRATRREGSREIGKGVEGQSVRRVAAIDGERTSRVREGRGFEGAVAAAELRDAVGRSAVVFEERIARRGRQVDDNVGRSTAEGERFGLVEGDERAGTQLNRAGFRPGVVDCERADVVPVHRDAIVIARALAAVVKDSVDRCEDRGGVVDGEGVAAGTAEEREGGDAGERHGRAAVEAVGAGVRSGRRDDERVVSAGSHNRERGLSRGEAVEQERAVTHISDSGGGTRRQIDREELRQPGDPRRCPGDVGTRFDVEVEPTRGSDSIRTDNEDLPGIRRRGPIEPPDGVERVVGEANAVEGGGRGRAVVVRVRGVVDRTQREVRILGNLKPAVGVDAVVAAAIRNDPDAIDVRVEVEAPEVGVFQRRVPGRRTDRSCRAGRAVNRIDAAGPRGSIVRDTQAVEAASGRSGIEPEDEFAQL